MGSKKVDYSSHYTCSAVADSAGGCCTGDVYCRARPALPADDRALLRSSCRRGRIQADSESRVGLGRIGRESAAQVRRDQLEEVKCVW